MEGIMKKILSVIVVIVVLMTACVKEKEPIRIGVNSWPPCEVWYLAEELGYFQDLPVELVRFTAWSDNMASLYVDKIDITHSTYFNSIYFSDKGEDAVLLAPIDYIVGGDGMAIKEDIEDIADLKGKKVAVEVGTDEHYLLYKALEIKGIGVDEIEIISTPSYEAHNAFIENRVAGIFTYEPFLSIGANDGSGKIVFTTADLPGHMIDALVTSKQASLNRNKDLKIVMDAWYKTLDYIKENPQESFELMSKNEDMTAEAFGDFFNGFVFYSEEEALEKLESVELNALLIEMQNFALKNKLITEVKDTKEILKSPLLK